jgi:hypothetical protein
LALAVACPLFVIPQRSGGICFCLRLCLFLLVSLSAVKGEESPHFHLSAISVKHTLAMDHPTR